jgi:ADP-heptose:LPS heptosyltransferase
LLEARHPAVIFSNGFGDHLLNLPALRALAQLFPQRLTLVCQTWARETFFSDLPLSHVCEVDMHSGDDGSRVFDAEGVALNIGPCDLLISLNPWHSDSVDRLIELLSPAGSVGFFPSFQTRLPLDFSKHSAELAFDIPRQIDPRLRLKDFSWPPVFSPRFRQSARRIREIVPARMRVMAVHADTWRVKMWPPERFISLLDDFLDSHPDFVVLVVGRKNLHLDSGRCGDRVIPCYGLAFPASATLVAEADLFLGIDSCMMHVADLFRVPGVGLFGPTNSLEWGFRFGIGRHVCAEGPMEGIEQAAVLEALESLIAETASSKISNISR